jgi:sugar phosphate isomerase/epimerase
MNPVEGDPPMQSGTLSRRKILVGTLAAGAARVLNAAPATRPAYRWRPAGGVRGYPIGIYTRPWAEHDYRVALDAIAEAGFQYCGLMSAKGGLVLSRATPLEEAGKVGEEVKKRKLRVLSVYGGEIPTDSVEDGVKGLRKLIDNCAAVGSMNLLMGGVGDEKAYKIYYRAIAECCDYAKEKKLGISIKPHGGLNATGPQVRKTVEMVDNPNFRIWYDAGNIYYYSDGKLDPVEDAPTVDGLVTGWCIKDFLPPKNVDVTPGEGKVDFAKVFAVLKKGGFTRGPLVIETLGKGDLPKLLAEAKKAREFVEKLVTG